MEIKNLLKEALKYLDGLDYTNPYFEARLILSRIISKDQSYLVAHQEEDLSEELSQKYLDILKKRSQGWPLAYIMGETEFYGFKFYVDQGVLIPRKDTEISVELISSLIEKYDIKNILEIGSGTGIVSISLGKIYPNLEIDAVDISDKALLNSQKNIKLHGLKNINLFKSDIYSNVKSSYDLIYSNPPYIRKKEIKNLQKEIAFEPVTALDGGEDGLNFYRKIIAGMDKFLKKDGFLVLEIGSDQKEDIFKLLEPYNHACKKDLSSLDRVIIASKGEIDV